MSLRVVFLRSAEQDLRELRAYIIKNFGKGTWQTSYTGIKDAVSAIRNFPLGGSLPEELEKLNLMQYRQVLSGMNRIIYEVRQETIYIHIVCDTRKDMKTLLARRLLRVS
ncbi:MAG: type II toxin-antitoxin system RelE/ParE family toxin [Pseudomonadota bacterium]|jgi:plasmid stabilization system protein ParE